MSTSVGRNAVLASITLLAAARAGRAQTVSPVGQEFQVNSYTPGRQRNAAVALDGAGGFVVAWSSAGQDGSNYGVFARRFNAAGVGQATEFQVNLRTADYQSYPAVARRANGDFVVVWASAGGQDGSSYGVFGRRFDSAGVPQAGEFQANTYTPLNQGPPAVAIDADGDFVVAWKSNEQDGSLAGIFARRFSSAGVAQAVEFQVNTYTASGQYFPAVAVADDGRFVIAWQDAGHHDGDLDGIFARRFNSAGSALAAEFQVNVFTVERQTLPSVVMHGSTGDFAVIWDSYGEDGSGNGVFARRWSSAGAAVGPELQINAYATAQQRFSGAAMEGDGGFVVTWTSYGQDGSGYGIFARHVSPAGCIDSAELQVNTRVSGNQDHSAVGVDPSGGFVVAWKSANQDGGDEGVFAQRFTKLAILDIDGDGTTAALTDGLLVLRYLFGFTGATLVAGAVDGTSCTRCTAPSIEGYLQTLI
jgi:hypothetical protein